MYKYEHEARDNVSSTWRVREGRDLGKLIQLLYCNKSMSYKLNYDARLCTFSLVQISDIAIALRRGTSYITVLSVCR